jgi:hypothetical protein
MGLGQCKLVSFLPLLLLGPVSFEIAYISNEYQKQIVVSSKL